MKAFFLFLKNKKAQDLNSLYQFVLLIILIGMIIGVGIIVLDKFATSTFYTITDNDSIVINLFNESVPINNGNITTYIVKNATSQSVAPTAFYTLDKINGSIKITSNGSVDEAWIFLGNSIEVIYTYKDYDTETKTATLSASKEVSNISTVWIGLIVTIFILAIILTLVIRSFGSLGGQGRN